MHPIALRYAPLAALLLGCGASNSNGPNLAAPDAGAPDDAAPPADLAPPCTPRTQFAATGYFRVDRDCDHPLLVDPDGKPFYSFGVNHVSWDGDYSPKSKSNPYADAARAKYTTEDAWATATAARLSDWGWNTVGSWSSYGSLGARMPYTKMLDLSGANWQSGAIPDYFDPQWEASVRMKAQAGTAGLSKDRNLIGYFIDNEMHWGPDWRAGTDLLDETMKLAASAPGKKALIALMQQRHNQDIASFNSDWKTSFADWDALAAQTKLPARGTSTGADADRSAFVTLSARRFFAVTTGAIRAVDPNHLVLGVRFVASLTPVEVAVAAGEALDVVSVNSYEYTVDPQSIYRPDVYNFVDMSEGGFLEGFYTLTHKPILITEFGFRAKDSGLPNTWPPFYPTLATQSERADRFEEYARRALASPWIVGYHWFEWADEPSAGRFDGEDNNWGLVTSGDAPYEELTARSKQVNRPPWAPSNQ